MPELATTPHVAGRSRFRRDQPVSGSQPKPLLREASLALAEVSGSAQLDAELLLAHALDWPRSRLFARSDETLTPTAAQTFAGLLQRRLNGEPIAYILGQQEFWSLPLQVNAACLIPRPETEGLVTLALTDSRPQRRLLDLGTGSGAIALAIKSERAQWQLVAVERSAAALQVAQDNGARLGLAVDWRGGDWFEPVAGERFDWIISNPPYIRQHDPHLPALAHEPQTALVAGADGLAALRHIIATAPAHLNPGGHLAVEHGFDQRVAVGELLRSAGFDDIGCEADLAGHARISHGRWR